LLVTVNISFAPFTNTDLYYPNTTTDTPTPSRTLLITPATLQTAYFDDWIAGRRGRIDYKRQKYKILAKTT